MSRNCYLLISQTLRPIAQCRLKTDLESTIFQGFPFRSRMNATRQRCHGRWARSAHYECQRHEFVGGSGGILPLGNFENLSTLRCNLVHSGHLNLANART